MLTLFISDLHLDAAQPDTLARFQAFARGPAREAQALYILGDLFEYWIGDDDLDGPGDGVGRAVATTLQGLAAGGTRLYLMHGNRDFLLGQDFCAAAGMTWLPDPTCIDLYGVPTVLSHGDTLCTDDHAYLAFRHTVRDPAWQAAFLARPLDDRRNEVLEMRRRSEAEKAGKASAIMDACPVAIEAMLRRHAGARLIHGHTHRPARHAHTLDGRTCERWVLHDWRPDGAGYLRCTAAGCAAVPLPG